MFGGVPPILPLLGFCTMWYVKFSLSTSVASSFMSVDSFSLSVVLSSLATGGVLTRPCWGFCLSWVLLLEQVVISRAAARRQISS